MIVGPENSYYAPFIGRETSPSTKAAEPGLSIFPIGHALYLVGEDFPLFPPASINEFL